MIDVATAALARYDGLLEAIPNPGVLLSPLSTQEAVLSSKIEGTQVTLSEVLEIEAGGGEALPRPKLDDAEEIRNYRNALLYASSGVKTKRFTLFNLRESHRLLMQGVRGQNKAPGSFRQVQNWIGRPGALLDKASYVPASMEVLDSCMEQWMNYYQNRDVPNPLVQLAIIHAEFEAIHPFLDGNGRIGRMLIPLFLTERVKLQGPFFYMSGYLEERRDEYYERLKAVSRDGAWTEWCIFFLAGIAEQAVANQRMTQSIISLHKELRLDASIMPKSSVKERALEFMFSRPIFSSNDLVDEVGVKRYSVTRMLKKLCDVGILEQIRSARGTKPAIYKFSSLLDIIE